MDWIRNIIDSLAYVEKHLDDPRLGPETISKHLHITTSHYQRAFLILTGMNVSEYVRNRRLSLAAQKLTIEKLTVLDTALSLGYESPEAFCKAFKRFHGVNPKDVKKCGMPLKAFPPLQLKIILKGDDPMDYRLVDHKPFTLIGKSIEVSTENNENTTRIPIFWAESHQEGLITALCELPECEAIAGACIMPDHTSKSFTYAIAAIVPDAIEDSALSQWPIGSHTWAVFDCVGPMPHAIQNVWQRIYSEWFPATGFEHAKGPELEIYPPGDTQSSDYRCEIWIPIIK